MKISEYAEAVIKEHEGLRLKAYRCPSRVLTIGYGHTKNVKPGDVIDKATAEKYFVEDVEAVERLADSESFAKNLSQGQYDALVSFLFNERNYEFVTVTTNFTNERARHVYEKLGFKQSSLELKNEQTFVVYRMTKEDFVSFLE